MSYKRYSYDSEADALYCYLNEGAVDHTIECVRAAIMVDVTDAGTVIGVEILTPRPGMDLTPVRPVLTAHEFAYLSAVVAAPHHEGIRR